MSALAMRAVDAAMTAGASYADVRLTYTLSETYTDGEFGGRQSTTMSPNDLPNSGFTGGIQYGRTPNMVMGIGVRAFVQGYWGFAASPYWTEADAVRLGQDAARQATENARAGKPRPTDLGSVPVVRNARWVQPGIDPFSVSVAEKLDVLRSLLELPGQGLRFVDATFGTGLSLSLWRETRVFASSEESSYSQVRYHCIPKTFKVVINPDFEQSAAMRMSGQASWAPTALSGYGWELIRDLDQDELMEKLLSQAKAPATEPKPVIKPVEIGKYDVVFGAPATGRLVYHTLGVATELDRAMGYEANAGGTSYLGPDPMQYLGTAIASPKVNLTANRTTPHALATAEWDDEGVRCSAFPLIKKGILVDYQTTREQAHWLAKWYATQGRPVQSHGCAVAETALDVPIQMNPNFMLEPGAEAIDVDDLIKDTERGVYFPSGWLQVDQQVKNGIFHRGVIKLPREIRNGKLGPLLPDAGVLFNSTELWKNVIAVGGAASAKWAQASETKGEPSQRGQCNVCAVPMKVKDCAIIDTTRKA
jgi:TldD protein